MSQKNLDDKLHNYYVGAGRDPKMIIMHPTTWIDLKKEVWAENRTPISTDENDLRYRGIRVLRSSDLPVGWFEL